MYTGIISGSDFSNAKDTLESTGRTENDVPVTNTPWMSLRDYFAAQVLSGLVREDWPKATGAEDLADLAYALADAMMKRRAR